MIAHRIERKSGKDLYGRLACYILDVESARDPRVFERLASYVVDRAGEGERVVGTRITNCGAEDFSLAVAEIQATQAENRRAKGDKSYHLVISFPEGERPTLDQMRDIEDRLCEAIGLSDHQRISAIHDDTDNLHLHVAINKVHPETLRCVEPYYDKQKLMAACIELEVKHGLIRDNHGVEAERRQAQGEQKMEAHSGRETLRGWIMENAREALTNALGEAKSWDQLHQAFALHGLEIRPYGAGLVVGVPGQRASIKASDLGRDFGVAALTKRFGPYQRPSPEVQQTEAKQRYTRAPLQRTPEAQALFARYQTEREAAVAARAEARVQLETAHNTYAAELRKHYKGRRAAIRAESYIAGPERRTMFRDLAAERQQDWQDRRALVKSQRGKIDAANPLLTWQGFLEREASAGDEQALAALRSRSRSQSRIASEILTAPDVSAARHVIDRWHKASARKNGDMLYQVQDGGRVTDRAAEVRMDQLSTGAAFLALSLAVERFTDQPLILEGSDSFKAAIVAVSALPGFNVKFADPQLEHERQVAAKMRERDEAHRASDGTAEAYVAQRNELRQRIADIPAHRLWTAADIGEFQYVGRRAFPDGTEAVLLRRGDEVVVKPSTDAQVAKASKWSRGQAVFMDAQGRFRGSKESQRDVGAPDRSAQR